MVSRKVFHLVVMAINLAMGLICFACGIWFHASREIYSYMSIFVLSQNDKLLVAAAGIMLAVGVVLTFVCIFGIITLFIEKMKGLYKLVAIGFSLIMILAFIAGFLPIGLRYDIFRFVKQGMRNQLKTYYEWDSRLGMEWNRVQVKKRCCGIDGVWDYMDTNWFNSQNPDADDPKVFVPPSCCTLNFNQEREITWVDPQSLQLRDEVRCQEDARGKVANTANVHNKGCFVALFSKNPDLWHDQTIWVILDVISGVCLTTAVLQIFVLVATSLVPLDNHPSQRYKK